MADLVPYSEDSAAYEFCSTVNRRLLPMAILFRSSQTPGCPEVSEDDVPGQLEQGLLETEVVTEGARDVELHRGRA